MPVFRKNRGLIPIANGESDAESTTTSAIFIEKLSVLFTADGTSVYKVDYSFNTAHTQPNSQACLVIVELDDTTLLDTSVPAADTANRFTLSGGHKRMGVLTAGSHQVDIDFRNIITGTAKIQNARLEIFKIPT